MSSQPAETKKPAGDSEPFKPEAKSAEIVDPERSLVKHPLHNSWTLWFDSPKKKTRQEDWRANLKKVTTFRTVEDFWGNYHLFLEGIEPMWEDPKNKRGGKWIVTLKPAQRKDLDRLWLWSILACIGESFQEEGEVNGVVVSVRRGNDRIALWTKHSDNVDLIKSLGAQFKRSIELDNSIQISYQLHDEALKKGSSFNNKAVLEI